MSSSLRKKGREERMEGWGERWREERRERRKQGRNFQVRKGRKEEISPLAGNSDVPDVTGYWN